MRDATYWVYILASKKYGTLYVGVTNSVERRVAEHKSKDIGGFTKKHGVDRLVFFARSARSARRSGLRSS